MLGVCLLILGIGLSAFFSGSETGFYRVARVRLVMDAKSGNWVARALLWFISRSSVVVATVLIGNNLANYLVSLGLLLASQSVLARSGDWLSTLLPVLMTPFLFIYGELLPKYLYYQVPYRLLRLGAPLMLMSAALFAPVSIIVIGLEFLWQRVAGPSPSKTGSSLARQELQRVLTEGQEAGVVLPIQREIAQNLFIYGVRPVRQFCVPLRAIALVASSAERDEVLSQSRRFGQAIVGVTDGTKQNLIGCYLVSDLLLSTQDSPLPMQPVCRVKAADSNIQVLTRLQSSHSPIAQVADAQGRSIGVVTRERLTALLLSER